MPQVPSIDVSEAHRYFSTACFNKAWELIKKSERTMEEDEEMVRLSQASLWHWSQRDDCSSTNLSIGYWQASRIYAIVGRAEEAKRYGRLCLEHSRKERPFFLAYAYEALARAEKVAGNAAMANRYYAEAERIAGSVHDDEERAALLNDLSTLR
jgi:tetratricopeptide (TPR) repeat protein